MLTRHLLLPFALLLATGLSAQTWMFGPMLHYNIGGEKSRASFSLEASYWNYENFPWSIDFAIEFEKGKTRIYSEAQTGIVVAGVASGPVFQWDRTNKKVNLGFQGSVWANYFLGVNLRGRWIGGDGYFCPGTYFKLPMNALWEGGGGNGSSPDWDWDD